MSASKSCRTLVRAERHLIHQRIEALLGRPVWTHEMELNWEGLCQEARWEGRPSTLQEIIELIPEEKRIIIEIGAPDG